MMEMLMMNRKMVITKEKLLLKVWGYESDAEDNNVEVYISFLRKKLEHLHSQVKIRTIRMVGYCLERRRTSSFPQTSHFPLSTVVFNQEGRCSP
mgnify:CR=1 FL=1